jgi:hypothetical protein
MMLEQKIAQLDGAAALGAGVNPSELSNDLVRVGRDRQRQGREDGRQRQVHDRRSAEANPSREALQRVAGRQGAPGHKRGDTVDVSLPSGKKRKLKITKIDVA